MQLLVNNTYDSDLIECPDFIVANLLEYQQEYDRLAVINDLVVNLDTFIEWVNNTYLIDNDEKISINSSGIFPTEEQKKLPKLYY